MHGFSTTEHSSAAPAWVESCRELLCASYAAAPLPESASAHAPASTYGSVLQPAPSVFVTCAPAKINVHLGIYPHAPGEHGYHRADSIMMPLGLCDWVFMRPRNIDANATTGAATGAAINASTGATNPQVEDAISVEMSVSCGVETRNNTVYRAAHSMCAAFNKPAAFEIYVEKHIPVQSGLGGSSSDAAATIRALCSMWNISPHDERVIRVAQHIGADVAFFLWGNPTFLSGVGDELERMFPSVHVPVALIRPQLGVSTVEAYAMFDEHPTQPQLPGNMCLCLEAVSHSNAMDKNRSAAALGAPTCANAGAPCDPRAANAHALAMQHAAEEISQLLYNNLADAVMRTVPCVRDALTWAKSQPEVKGALVTGSGSAVFAFCSTTQDAQRVATRARLRNYRAYSTITVGLSDMVCYSKTCACDEAALCGADAGATQTTA